LTDGSISAVPDDATLEAVVEVFATEHLAWVPVLDVDRRIACIVGTADLIEAYRRSLTGSLRSPRSIFSGSILVEDEVGSTSAVSGRTIARAPWPSRTAVVAIQRGDQLIFPEPNTEVLAGDVLSALVPKNMEDRLRVVLGSDAASDRDAGDQPMI
jgi:hypothetical protein